VPPLCNRYKCVMPNANTTIPSIKCNVYNLSKVKLDVVTPPNSKYNKFGRDTRLHVITVQPQYDMLPYTIVYPKNDTAYVHTNTATPTATMLVLTPPCML